MQSNLEKHCLIPAQKGYKDSSRRPPVAVEVVGAVLYSWGGGGGGETTEGSSCCDCMGALAGPAHGQSA